MRSARTWFTLTMATALIATHVPTTVVAEELDEAEIFIEINDTDGDAGIQIFLDAEGWKRMKVFGPDGRRVLRVAATRGVGMQGITELFLESAEPSFDEQSLEEFMALFPEGTYTFSGKTTEGEPCFATHNLC